LIASGVDVLELGVPFSDPLADGLTNQLAAQRALESGTTREDVFDLVRAIRKENDTLPVVLYTYYNLMFSGGLDAYIAEAKEAGVDGLLFLDLHPEEAEDYMMAFEKVGMKTVFLLAPTTPVERVAYIAGFTTGFIYYVSRTGVTGVRDDLADDLKEMVDMIKSNSDKPLVVGFGIHSREQVKAVSDLADGVVVGSAIVNTIKDNLGNRDAILERMGFGEGLGRGNEDWINWVWNISAVGEASDHAFRAATDRLGDTRLRQRYSRIKKARSKSRLLKI
jgi:tryptophan synthase alpha chain